MNVRAEILRRMRQHSLTTDDLRAAGGKTAVVDLLSSRGIQPQPAPGEREITLHWNTIRELLDWLEGKSANHKPSSEKKFLYLLGGPVAASVQQRFFQQLSFQRQVAECLGEVRKEGGWERVRLYTFHDSLTFVGAAENGGTCGNFRRTVIPPSDVLSLILLIHGAGCIAYEREPGRLLIRDATSYDRCGMTSRPLHLHPAVESAGISKSACKSLTANDNPVLNRSGLTQWVDIALVCDGKIVGKCTADNLHNPESSVTDRLGNGDLWAAVDRLAKRLLLFQQGEFEALEIPEVSDDDPRCVEAARLQILKDQLLTLVVSLVVHDPRLSGLFDRGRVYLEGENWRSLFGRSARYDATVSPVNSPHFRWICETGGVPVMIDGRMIGTDDPCTTAVFGNPAGHPAISAFLRGEPVVFTRRDVEEADRARRFRVERDFLKPIEFGRSRWIGESLVEIPSHLDLPIVQDRGSQGSGKLVGKVTLDRLFRDSENEMDIPRLEPDHVRALQLHADRMAEVITAVHSLPVKELCESLNGHAGANNNGMLL